MRKKCLHYTFAIYLDIDVSEKPPRERIKTFFCDIWDVLQNVGVSNRFNCAIEVLCNSRFALSHSFSHSLSFSLTLCLSFYLSLSLSFSLTHTDTQTHSRNAVKHKNNNAEFFFFPNSILRAGGSRGFNMQTGSVLSEDLEEEKHWGFVLCFSCKTKEEEPELLMFPPDQHFPNYVSSMQMILRRKKLALVRPPFLMHALPFAKIGIHAPLCAGTSKRLCSSGESWICCVAVHPQGCNISASVLCVTAHLAKSRATDMEITDSEVDEDAHW